MTILLIAHDAALANAAERTIRIGGPASESAAVSVRPVRKLADDAPTAVELENVSFAYPGSSPVLDGVSLSVRAGELACVTGPNGAGKSTLLSLMNGLLTPDAGEVRLFGEPARGAKARGQARFTVGLAFQQPERQLFSATVFDDVAFGPRNMGLSADEVEERVRWAIDAVGLPFDEVYKRSPFTLSGGQQRKAALAGVLAMRTPVLALDEPAAGLDVASKRELLELLCRLSGEGACVIMVTHDANDVQLLGCREIALP
ncbi:MAG: ATP-binding cassette domain-containing protein [Eggerthellaceae bacterium]|nr:ATP-binding cassette domain-containing protein [Eggerthellaceae bacterium]